jgi:hypothetical protein
MMCPENPLEFARYDDRQFLCQRALQGTPPITLFTSKDGVGDELLQSHPFYFLESEARVPPAA